MKTTVLMPVHNGEKFLENAIESILEQTFTDFEFLIIDDGSTDETIEILNRYKKIDKRIILIQHENKEGIVKSLNEGLKAAHGSYIARMDADDISLPNRLKKQTAFLDAHPAIAVVGTWFQYINENNHISTVIKNHCEPIVVDFHGLFFNPVAHPTVMFRRDEILNLGGYRESAYHIEDFDLWSRFPMSRSITNIPEILFNYRIHKKSVSRSNKTLQTQSSQAVVLQNIKKYGDFKSEDAALLKLSFSPNLHYYKMAIRQQKILRRLLDGYAQVEKLSKQEITQIEDSLKVYDPMYLSANFIYSVLKNKIA